MTAAAVSNNKAPRKQLSDQLDRLDAMLDGLSEGLNEAVADAAREGTRLALKDAIVEIMTDPALRARLHQATAPEPERRRPSRPDLRTEPKQGFWARMKAKASQAVKAAANTASEAVQGVVGGAKAVAANAAAAVQAVSRLGSPRRLAAIGLTAGLVVGVGSFLAPHAVAAAISALGVAVAAAAVQLGVWTRRAFRALTVT